MNKPMLNRLCLTAIVTGILLTAACKKNDIAATETVNETSTIFSKTSNANSTLAVGETLLNVTYESNTENSDISGVDATHATEPDAAYVVGAPGTYRIAHKVTLGLPGYYSDKAYRSESDADGVTAARFYPGQERRYEFSVLLKDWEQWNSANPAYGDNLFQLKVSGGAIVPVRILTKRNAIVTRNTSNQDNLLTDFRPYINKWLHFRIDVKWASDNTGYLKIYLKPEGTSTYNLVLDRPNYATYTGTGLSGQHGYIKWGVYREAGYDTNDNLITNDNVLTRIAYHDNIKIISLN